MDEREHVPTPPYRREDLIFDNLASFACPVPLPCFVMDERKLDVWADGYSCLETIFDGRTNRLRKTPLVRLAMSAFAPIGQSYTIGHRALQRAIAEGMITDQRQRERESGVTTGKSCGCTGK
jgi:hypothetical protein